MKENIIYKIVRLSLFLAISIILSIVESMISYSLPVFGIRLGIANIMTLLVLYYYSIKEYLFIGFSRVLLVAILYSGFNVSFYLSLTGWFFSSLISILLYKTLKPSIYGLSVTSSITHLTFQVLLVFLIYEVKEIIYYLPFLLISGIISGSIIAFISKYIILLLNKIYKVKEVVIWN